MTLEGALTVALVAPAIALGAAVYAVAAESDPYVVGGAIVAALAALWASIRMGKATVENISKARKKARTEQQEMRQEQQALTVALQAATEKGAEVVRALEGQSDVARLSDIHALSETFQAHAKEEAAREIKRAKREAKRWDLLMRGQTTAVRGIHLHADVIAVILMSLEAGVTVDVAALKTKLDARPKGGDLLSELEQEMRDLADDSSTELPMAKP